MQVRSRETPIEYASPIEKHRGRFLPHWHTKDGIYFVTYGLRDAIPSHRLRELSEQRERDLERLKLQNELTPKLQRKIDDRYLAATDYLFDQQHGSRILEHPNVAGIVADAFEYFHGERYDLICWVIMPTHVHAALGARGDERLSDIVHSWKSFTANKINDVVGRDGYLWHSDYYDRLVRTEEELNRYREYIWNNPEMAGLSDWQWRKQYKFRIK